GTSADLAGARARAPLGELADRGEASEVECRMIQVVAGGEATVSDGGGAGVDDNAAGTVVTHRISRGAGVGGLGHPPRAGCLRQHHGEEGSQRQREYAPRRGHRAGRTLRWPHCTPCGVWVCCPRVWSCECWWCSCVLCIAYSFLVLPHACSVVVFDCRAGGGGGGTSLNFLKWKG